MCDDCISVFLQETLSLSCVLQTSKAVDSVSTDRRCQFELPASGTGECAIEGVLACKVAATDGKVNR